jgi:hypothetical protein
MPLEVGIFNASALIDADVSESIPAQETSMAVNSKM